jgi:hypothetical protein
VNILSVLDEACSEDRRIAVSDRPFQCDKSHLGDYGFNCWEFSRGTTTVPDKSGPEWDHSHGADLVVTPNIFQRSDKYIARENQARRSCDIS